MRLDEYECAVDLLLTLAKRVEDSKRPSYTAGNPDVLHNFKLDADMAKILPTQNWATHMLKQAAALARWAQDPDRPQSEPVEQRFADLVNYAKLGFAMMIEREQTAGEEAEA